MTESVELAGKTEHEKTLIMLRKRAALGQEASGLMANPAFVAAMEATRQSIVDSWLASSVREPEEQARLLMQAKCIDIVQTHILSFIDAGKAADEDINREIERSRRELEELENEREGIFARGMRNVRHLASR